MKGRCKVLANGTFYIQLIPTESDDDQSIDDLTAILRDELLELDVSAVDAIQQGAIPDNSKGVASAVGGWLAVHLGQASLKSVVSAVMAWATRSGRTIELSINGDTLKLTGATAEVQSRVVQEFFEARDSKA